MTTSKLRRLLDEQQIETPTHAIVRALGSGGSMSAAALCRATNLAKSTISIALSELRKSGIVVDAAVMERGSGQVGRPATAVQLNPQAGTCVGMHLELRGVRVCVADVAHSIIDELFMPLNQDFSPAEAVAAATKAIGELYGTNHLSQSQLLGVGVSISSPVTPEGVVHQGSILPAWAGVDAKRLFSDAFPAPVFIENESNCAAIAEMMWGAASEHKNFVLLKIDLGVGGAVVCDGRVIKGAAGGAGEFGHMSIEQNGQLCPCGNRGCLELAASLRRPVKEMGEILGRPSSIDEIILLAERGDVGATRLINDCGEAAGRGLAMICAVINPPLVIVSGRGALAGDLLLKPLKREFEKTALIKSSESLPDNRTTITTGKFTENDSLHGAVGLVLQSLGNGH